MPEIDGFKDGLPSWADLASPDPDESVSFYKELLGLEATEADEEMGGYRMFTSQDRQVAGLMQIQDENQPPSWTTYINVSDADAVAEKVKEADGEVYVEPMDIREYGRMAVFADPTGAVFGVWQPGEHKGAGVVSEPGSIAWHQCNTRDPEKALEFYSEVFGWESEKVDTGGADYWQMTADDSLVGGLFRMGDDFPDDVPGHWIVYFAVEDADAATEKARENGATRRRRAVRQRGRPLLRAAGPPRGRVRPDQPGRRQRGGRRQEARRHPARATRTRPTTATTSGGDEEHSSKE